MEMVTGNKPFHKEFAGLTAHQIILKIGDGKMHPEEAIPLHVSKDLKDFIIQCLNL